MGQVRRASLSASKHMSSARIVEQTTLDFDKLMNSRDGVEAMAKFAAGEYADENVRFWMAVQKFKEDYPAQLEGAGEKEASSDVGLSTAAAAIIDKFLCRDAEMLVNLPSEMLAKYAEPSTSGGYQYTVDMFDSQSAEIRRLIFNDTFSRFKLSDDAESLLWDVPMLGTSKEEVSNAFQEERSQLKIRPLVVQAQEMTGADRVTAWLIDGDVMWSIASTKLGNAIIQIPYGAGLAGRSAKSGVDLIIEDAYQDPTFNTQIDKV